MDSSRDLNKPSVIGYPSMDKKYYPHATPQVPPGYPMAYQGGYAHAPPYQGGYVPPYQGYPHVSAHPGSKNYGSPSFNVIYGAQSYASWVPEQDNNAQKFGRLMLATMITLLVSMCMVSLAIWYLFGTEVPEFEVASFSVSNFNITDSAIEANWEANVTIRNPNANLNVNSGPVKVSIIYKNFPLAMSSVEPFDIQGNEVYNLRFKLEDQLAAGKEMLGTEIVKDQSGGIMFLSLRLGLGAKFTSTTIWRKESLRVFCEDLKVVFADNGIGALAEDSPRECLIFT